MTLLGNTLKHTLDRSFSHPVSYRQRQSTCSRGRRSTVHNQNTKPRKFLDTLRPQTSLHRTLLTEKSIERFVCPHVDLMTVQMSDKMQKV